MHNYKEISEFVLKNFTKLQKYVKYSKSFIKQVELEYVVGTLEKHNQNHQFFIKRNSKNEIIALLHSGIHTQDDTIALIFWIFVDEDSTGKGLGKELFGDCIDYYTNKGYAKIYSVAHKQNKASIGLHDGFSFNTRYTTEDEICYEKILEI